MEFTEIILQIMRGITMLVALCAAYMAVKNRKVGRSFLLLMILFMEYTMFSKANIPQFVKSFSVISFFLIVSLVIFFNGYDWKLETKVENWLIKKY